MIGTGVFLKTGSTCNVGSAKLVLVVWLAAGLFCRWPGTFAYSEIAAMMPEAGGDYVYARPPAGWSAPLWLLRAVAAPASGRAFAVGLAIFMNGPWAAPWIGHFGISSLTLVALRAI